MKTENLTIGKKDFSAELTEVNQADLKFYLENPRVYSVLNLAGVEPTQEEIERHMCNLEHVKQLKVSIESNGGLIDPLIVRAGDFTVLEGNSRLAAYRLLCETDPVKWGKVRCKLLPADISEDTIFTLLGQYHIIGRKDWEPFEQAHYLYRRHQKTKLPIEYMAQELGISKQKAKNMVCVIEFMIEKDDLNKRHWSYYEEYLKNSSLKKYRETNPDIDDTIAEAVKSDQIREASDMRKLGEIAKVGDRQSKKVMQYIACGKTDLYEGYARVEESGKLDDAIKRLKTFRSLINGDSFEKQLKVSIETAQQAQFEIGKIIRRLTSIQEKWRNNMNHNILNFFSCTIEKEINKKTLYYEYIFPRQEAYEYVSNIIAMPIPLILDYILSEQEDEPILSGDVFQFSNLDDATYRICSLLADANNTGVTYLNAGKLLLNDGKIRTDSALIKYGENHLKTAASLGLLFEITKTYFLSYIGYVINEFNEEGRQKLLVRLTMRNKLIKRLYRASQNGDVDMRQFFSCSQTQHICDVEAM